MLNETSMSTEALACNLEQVASDLQVLKQKMNVKSQVFTGLKTVKTIVQSLRMIMNMMMIMEEDKEEVQLYCNWMGEKEKAEEHLSVKILADSVVTDATKIGTDRI